MDSEILDQLTNLGRDVDSEFPKPKRGRRKKADPKMNELEDNDVREKRERLVACVLSGNSKMYLGKEYTEQQINEMDYNSINTLLNRYESVLSAQNTKSLGKSVINLYSNLACSVLGVDNQQDLSDDLECDPFLNTAMQRFTCDLYYRFGALLAPVSVGIITGKHYAKNSITKYLYNAFVFSRLNYGIELYANLNSRSHLHPLMVTQNKIFKILQFKKHRSNTNAPYKEYCVLKVEDQHKFNICCLIHKTIHHPGNIPTSMNELLILHKDMTSTILEIKIISMPHISII